MTDDFSPVGNFVVGSWCYIRNFINTYINFDFLNSAHINSINFSIGYLIFTRWMILKSEKWNWSHSVMSISWTQDPMDCSLPGSSIHGIFQSRILEWVAISFYRRSLWLRDWTRVSHIVGRLFTIWTTREVLKLSYCLPKKKKKDSFDFSYLILNLICLIVLINT